ncbi:hypothetical protein V6N13_004893 [Hibiscus sabdariffa]|uniref:Uncharacterized protein n=1 Tax=Hibiscus sabdariffa TaxID=183260 RepID=A0ABR2S090_9ROSI
MEVERRYTYSDVYGTGRVGETQQREGWGVGDCLVREVPSIIGGGSFVQHRGQTVVGTTLFRAYTREISFGNWKLIPWIVSPV